MAKKGDHTDSFLQMLNQMKDMLQNMNEEQREESADHDLQKTTVQTK